MANERCPVCGGEGSETKTVDYLYSHRGRYLLVPNTPVEVCPECGMAFYEARVLKEIERRFRAIESHSEKPESYISIPIVAYS
jgi:YgiT-type zinc finger domain-containing protein